VVIAGKFKREDLARALLNTLVLDTVQCVQLVSNCHGIKRVFFCGGFGSTPLVRRMITTEWVRRNLQLITFGSVTHLSFLFRFVTKNCQQCFYVYGTFVVNKDSQCCVTVTPE